MESSEGQCDEAELKERGKNIPLVLEGSLCFGDPVASWEGRGAVRPSCFKPRRRVVRQRKMQISMMFKIKGKLTRDNSSSTEPDQSVYHVGDNQKIKFWGK